MVITNLYIRYYGMYIGILIVILYVLPFIILGQDSYIIIHDNLDGEFIYRIILARNGYLFSSNATVEQIMNGIPRSVFPSGLNITIWLLLVLQPFTAYIVNMFLVRLVAFIGMYVLLKKHFLQGDEHILAVFGSSLCFSLLPFYYIHGLTIAGQPLLLYSFMNLLKNDFKVYDFIIILIFPFYSSLVLSGVFILFILGCYFFYDTLKNKAINLAFFSGLLILGLTYALVEYNLINIMFLSNSFVSHRTEWIPDVWDYSFKDDIARSLSNFLFGQYHAASLHTAIVVSLPFVAAILIKKRALRKERSRLLLISITLALIISFLYGLFHWIGSTPLTEKFPLLRTFQFSRFHWLHPLIWYIIFALVLSIVCQRKYGKYVVLLLVAFQLAYVTSWNYNTMSHIKIIIKKKIGRRISEVSYREFFSEDLFQQITESINQPKSSYRVASIGIHPSIAQYNGFYTLDSYQNNYSLEYKHKFRRIIKNELAKSEKWRKYFDNWGSRCYVFVAEMEKEGSQVRKEWGIKIYDLSLNTEAFKKMGGKYIFSAVEIVNAADNQLELVRVFDHADSAWRIFLYAVR